MHCAHTLHAKRSPVRVRMPFNHVYVIDAPATCGAPARPHICYPPATRCMHCGPVMISVLHICLAVGVNLCEPMTRVIAGRFS